MLYTHAPLLSLSLSREISYLILLPTEHEVREDEVASGSDSSNLRMKREKEQR